MNRVASHIETVRARCNALPQDRRDALDADMAITPGEHFSFQETQARAHASGDLSLDEAQIVYIALGEGGSAANGGWAEGTDLATKVTVTMLVTELMRKRMGIRA
jgi:hypothetical protein